MCNIFKSQLATGYWLRDEGGTGLLKFLLEPLLRPCFIKEAASSPYHDFLLLFSQNLDYQWNTIISLFNMQLLNGFSTCFAFMRVAPNHRHVICKRNCWKIP